MISKTAIVTGANGFIGVNLCNRLKQDHWRVIALVRQGSDSTFLEDMGVEKIYGSITDLEGLKDVFPKKADAVFHLAGVTSQFYKDFETQTKVNVLGTKNMIEVCHSNEIARFIHISSIMAFGLHDGTISETTVSNATEINNNYAATKWEGERLVIEACKKGLNAVVVNPSHIIGPYDKVNIIQLFEAVEENSLPGVPPGSGMFCHVTDVCEAIIQAYEKGESGEKYLIGGVHLSFKNVTDEIQKQLKSTRKIKVIPKWVFKLILPFYSIQSWFTGKEPLLTKGKIEITCENIKCDDSKAIKAFDLKYKSLEEMVSDTLRWKKSQTV